MRWTNWIGLIALALAAAPALARPPDRIDQHSGQITQLGKRLAPLNAQRDDRPSAAHWRAVKRAIDKSDARADARGDIAAGHIGLMTHANDTIAERPHAPALHCYIRSEPGQRAAFLFRYKAGLARAQAEALLAFDGYARAYNAEILSSGALGETTCSASGE